MANLFIGFPVPRAKIADMIDGAAPPLEHKTQHQDGGDDELDLTGMEGAGGEAFPLRGMWLDDWYLDDARYHTQYAGDGELTRSYATLSLTSTDTTSSNARLWLIIPQPVPFLTWDKKRHLLFQAYWDCDDSENTYIWIILGSRDGDNHMGFKYWNKELSTRNRNSGGSTETVVKSFSPGYIGEDIVLEAILFPGEKIEFYVNRVLAHTETSRLPAGTDDANYIFYVYVDNNDSANNVQLDFTHIQFFQAG